MPSLQLEDIQGLVLSGYGRLKGACYVGLRIGEAAAARAWLGALPLRSAGASPTEADTCVNVAFTRRGLENLGLDRDLIAMFAGEFREGMSATAHRQRLLGDLDGSAPNEWDWGGPRREVDIMLMLYAKDDAAVRALLEQHRSRWLHAGLTPEVELDTHWLLAFKEHFGFNDGISQPHVEGRGDAGPAHNTIAAGEFVLGYTNAYGQFVERPLLPPERDPAAILPSAPDQPGMRDLGMNGSYMVFRQLSQDVAGFWGFLAEKTRGAHGPIDTDAQIRLAAKMVGRWPDGAPLVKAPDAAPQLPSRDNDFLYYGSDDAHGFKCPIGAHVRRTNPRDALDPEPGSPRSIEVGKRHRILRRGRTYGPPVVESMDIVEIAAAPRSRAQRGLHFICFNTHIGRQFEFIQHTWVNSQKFDGLYSDDDPLVGPRIAANGQGSTFTMQADPICKRVTGLPRFVHTRGGAYFFMPGLRAVRYLASL